MKEVGEKVVTSVEGVQPLRIDDPELRRLPADRFVEGFVSRVSLGV